MLIYYFTKEYFPGINYEIYIPKSTDISAQTFEDFFFKFRIVKHMSEYSLP
jgi:hypothetical protein